MTYGVGNAAAWEAAAGLAVIVVGYIISRASRRKLRGKALAGEVALAAAGQAVRDNSTRNPRAPGPSGTA
jgi:hypothetical protein